LARWRTTPGTVMGGLALFISLSGVAYAATGGNFILGQSNNATTQTKLTANVAARTLQLENGSTGAGASALGLTVASGKAPLTVNSNTRVANLNADLLDGRSSTAFLLKGVHVSADASAAGGVVDVTNTGSSNGVQGLTGSFAASGVYGENTSGFGFGVAGRAGDDGHAIYGDNTGSGFAGYFEDKVFLGGNLVCSGCVGASDISGPVDDSLKLGGIDPTGFIQGTGKAAGQAAAITPGVNLFLGPAMLGFLRLSYQCPNTLSNNGIFIIYNDSGSVANVFVESGAANPTYTQMAAGTQMNLGASATGDSFHIQAQGALGIITIEAATVNRATDCHAQAQALLTG
jgi:hypothetical protein